MISNIRSWYRGMTSKKIGTETTVEFRELSLELIDWCIVRILQSERKIMNDPIENC